METAKMLSQVEKDMSCKQTNLSWGSGELSRAEGWPLSSLFAPGREKN